MSWPFFVVGAILSWGLYGPMLHKGQVALGNPLRALLCAVSYTHLTLPTICSV